MFTVRTGSAPTLRISATTRLLHQGSQEQGWSRRAITYPTSEMQGMHARLFDKVPRWHYPEPIPHFPSKGLSLLLPISCRMRAPCTVPLGRCVVDQASPRLPSPESHLKSIHHKLGAQVVSHRPTTFLE